MSGTNGNGTSGSIPFDEGMCERYLLGELREPEQELFETAYFNDDAFFNRFLAIKDELLDLYSRNELNADKRRNIETHFRSTAPRRQRMAESREFIHALTVIAGRTAPVSPVGRVIEPEPESTFESVKRFFTAPALAACGLIVAVLAIGYWMTSGPAAPDRAAEPGDQKGSAEVSSNGEVGLENTVPDGNQGKPEQASAEPSLLPKLPEESEIAISAQTNVPSGNTHVPVPSRSVIPTEPQPGPTATPESRVAEVLKPEEPKQADAGDRTEAVTLSSTSRSVTRRNTASIGAATRNVIVRMLFGGEAYASYSVRISTLGGETVWRASNITIGMNDGPRSLAVTVPAGSLNRKDYIVILEGRSKDGRSETIREYYLHVDRH